jgi:hypothetical protein
MDGRYPLPNARSEECRCLSKPSDPGLKHEARDSRRRRRPDAKSNQDVRKARVSLRVYSTTHAP